MCRCCPHRAILSRREADPSKRAASVLPARSPLGASFFILFRLLGGDLECRLKSELCKLKNHEFSIKSFRSTLVMTAMVLQVAWNGAAKVT